MIYRYLLEIKYRVFFSFIAWGFMIVICYYFKETLLYIFIKPSLNSIDNDSFYFLTTNIAEIFMTYIHLSYFITNQIIIVFLCYQIFVFISTGLYAFEYLYLKTLLLTVAVCWGLLIILLNSIVFSTSWGFFLKFQQLLSFQGLTFYFEAKLNEYLDFYKSVYYVCNLVLQTIVLFFILLDLFKTNLLIVKKFRKSFYFVFFILATFITPPEVVYQVVVSICIVIIYELVIIYMILKTEFTSIKLVTN